MMWHHTNPSSQSTWFISILHFTPLKLALHSSLFFVYCSTCVSYLFYSLLSYCSVLFVYCCHYVSTTFLLLSFVICSYTTTTTILYRISFLYCDPPTVFSYKCMLLLQVIYITYLYVVPCSFCLIPNYYYLLY